MILLLCTFQPAIDNFLNMVQCIVVGGSDTKCSSKISRILVEVRSKDVFLNLTKFPF